MRALALTLLLSACSGPPAPVDGGSDAGFERPTTGLYRSPEAPLPPGPLVCGRSFDVFRHGMLSPELGGVSMGTLHLAPGGSSGGEPVFPFATQGGGGRTGLVFPYVMDDLAVAVFESPSVAWSARTTGGAFVGSAIVFIEPGGARELVMFDPLTRTTRLRRALEAAPEPDARLVVAQREGGVLVAHGQLTYVPLLPAFEPDGEPIVVDVGVALEGLRLVNTSEGLVALAISACGVVTHWLDPSGAPADDPICLDRPETPTGEPIWDGSRIVWPFARGVLELDARGRPATWTPTPDFGLVAAFGGADGIVGLQVPTSARQAPGIVVLRRESGALHDFLSGPPRAGTYEIPGAAAVALSERRAWMLYQLGAGRSLVSIVIDCETAP